MLYFEMKAGRCARRTAAVMGMLFAGLSSGACGDSVFDEPGGGSADPPVIGEVTGPGSVSAGDELRLDITATGPRPIGTININVRAGATGRDTVVTVTPVQALDETVLIPLSPTLSGTQLVVTVTVEDDQGTESEPRTLTIEIEDVSAPVVFIERPIRPDSTLSGDTTAVGTGATMRVEAHVFDESGITEVSFVGLALRGDPELGTDTEVVRFEERIVTFPRQEGDTLPTDTIIRRDLTQVDEETETVAVIVTATDLFGNVSADTVPVIVGGPDVQILRPEDNSTHRRTADLVIRIAVTDPGGVESATLTLAGVVNRTVPLAIAGLPTTDTITYNLAAADIPNTGTLVISASARNVRGVAAPGTPVVVAVVDGSADDEAPPSVTFSLQPLPRPNGPYQRVEMLDTLDIYAEADDMGGVGVTSIDVELDAFLSGTDSALAVLSFTETYATPVTNPDMTVRVAIRDIYDAADATLAASVNLPDRMDIRVRVIATDQQGNADTATVAEGGVGERGYLLAVAGYTVNLIDGGIISDAVIDTVAGFERLFLSNFTRSRVDVLRLQDTTFIAPIFAGAQPWGLFIGGHDPVGDAVSVDTLIVANSGGTNLSKIPLRNATLEERHSERVHTPDASVFQLTREIDESLNLRYTAAIFGYSDRPQFVSQAISGALLYSTVPTSEALEGTIRIAIREPGWDRYEVYFLFPGGDPADESFADRFIILNADQIALVSTTVGDSIRIIDHVPGFPDMRIDVVGDEDTAFDLARAAGSDVVKCAGGFASSGVGLQDTTFVAGSGNREWIAFGEGATEENAGRIIMFDGATTEPLTEGCSAAGQSTAVQIEDLIDNAAERVTGLGLNENGTLGVARGDFAAYYFNRDLRLEGSYEEDINPGGFGAALHPSLDTQFGPPGPTTLSFVGTAESTIRIIDTWHFTTRGEVPIRDQIVGPLRATLPLQGFDNQGLVCPGDDRCVVVKLFGVTQSEGSTQPDGVVLIDVRERDIVPVQ